MTKITEDLNQLANKIWDYAETGFLETKSSAAMVQELEKEGFTITKGIAGMPTSYVGVWGSGKPVISFLAEYDALFSMNQKADIEHYEPVTASEDTGHGCGHNLLGTGAIYAAILYKNYLEENKLGGTVKIFGCPAEESGSGKAYLAREGFMNDTDIALTWHPSNYNQVCTGSSQSCISVFYKFHGVSSHAASAPQLGRSALDACELMNIGVNYLREHMEDCDRIHYAYLNAGGKAPNVIPSEAILKYFIRSETNSKCTSLYKRVNDVARGAALMTGCSVDIVFDEGLSNTVPNFVIEDVLADSFAKLYKDTYTPEEREYAKRFKETYELNNVLSDLPKFAKDKQRIRKNIEGSEIHDYFMETQHSDVCEMGSTDVGDISWVVPTGQINTACYSHGAGAHTWQWVTQGKSSIAHKGYQLAGEVMADAAKTFHDNPELIAKAKKELADRLQEESYQCLIPIDIKPHVSNLE